MTNRNIPVTTAPAHLTNLTRDISKIRPREAHWMGFESRDEQKLREFLDAAKENNGYNECVKEINQHMSPHGPFYKPVSVTYGRSHPQAPTSVDQLVLGALSIDEWTEIFTYHSLDPHKQERLTTTELEQVFIEEWKSYAGIIDTESDDE
ncbi:hypothetical protein ABW21_db0200045 [Orbilia brochopaga]|nr:hypothetical protein ABW21_db0200045 [Drechslerella brochopaga]